MIIVCTGGRDHKDADFVDKVLNSLNPIGVIVGDCPSGVDLYVRSWCRVKSIKFTVFEANWNKHGKAAGPFRNKDMLIFGRNMKAIVVAFKGGKGTADCIRQAKATNMIVLEAK